MGKQSGWQQFGPDAKAGGQSSWDQKGVRVQLGCCVTAGQVLVHSGSLWAAGVLGAIPERCSHWSLFVGGKNLGTLLVIPLDEGPTYRDVTVGNCNPPHHSLAIVSVNAASD